MNDKILNARKKMEAIVKEIASSYSNKDKAIEAIRLRYTAMSIAMASNLASKYIKRKDTSLFKTEQSKGKNVIYILNHRRARV